MLSLTVFALLASQILSAEFSEDEFTLAQFGQLQIHLQLGSVLDILSMPTLPTSVPNLHVQRMVASENMGLSSNLDGYFVSGFYDDDKCSNIVTAATTQLNTCISITPQLHQLVTATSTKIVASYYSDAECTDATMMMAWPPTCVGGMKFFNSPTKAFMLDRPHVAMR
jgi:hypothetical protein